VRGAPWSIEERQESFIVKDVNGQQLAAHPQYIEIGAAAAIDEKAVARRGVHCQAAAKRAAADSEGHSEAAKFGQSG